MSQQLNAFFKIVSSDPALQDQLYLTKEVADVAAIAKDLGYDVTGAEILRAQAGRVLMLPSEELEIVASGERAKTGAQWGRRGKGYLDSAGFWVNAFIEWGYTDSAFEPQFEAFLDGIAKNNMIKAELLLAKSCKDVANIAKKHGYDVNGSVVLRYQAIQILKLNDEKAEQVAAGAN